MWLDSKHSDFKENIGTLASLHSQKPYKLEGFLTNRKR